MKILLVEDSRLERHKTSRYLTDWRLDFVAVESGTEAVTQLEGSEPPNMVLLDWMLPDLDGIDVCRRIRTIGASCVSFSAQLPCHVNRVILQKHRGQDTCYKMPLATSSAYPCQTCGVGRH